MRMLKCFGSNFYVFANRGSCNLESPLRQRRWCTAHSMMDDDFSLLNVVLAKLLLPLHLIHRLLVGDVLVTRCFIYTWPFRRPGHTTWLGYMRCIPCRAFRVRILHDSTRDIVETFRVDLGRKGITSPREDFVTSCVLCCLFPMLVLVASKFGAQQLLVEYQRRCRQLQLMLMTPRHLSPSPKQSGLGEALMG